MIEPIKDSMQSESRRRKFDESCLDDVRKMAVSQFDGSALSDIVRQFDGELVGGKMLRARLVIRVGLANGLQYETLIRAAAAVELMHAASLLHDDVIDEGELRRGKPAFWVSKGVSGSILLGDLLVCKALSVLSGDAEHLVVPFIRYAAEMCDAEAEQELVLRGTEMDWDQSVSTARRKTGSLFAFAAHAAAGRDADLLNSLVENGYAVGTAYQLADDIMDAYGTAADSDKTLGKDADRSKNTAAVAWKLDNVDPIEYISSLYGTCCSRLKPWSELAEAWDEYLESDVGPVIKAFVDKFSLETI